MTAAPDRVGGHPVLDFLNTIHDWTVPDPRDRVATAPELARFAREVGLLSPAEGRGAPGAPGAAEMGRVRALRDVLARIGAALIGGRPPDQGDLRALTAAGAQAAGARRLAAASGRLVSTVDAGRAGAATIRLRLADAAIRLFRSEATARLKRCPACGWFFLDESKNGSRRWCSMATCGGTAKARRYYQRARGRRPGRDA